MSTSVPAVPSTHATAAVPTHHTTHELSGADAIKLDDLSTPDDNTDLNSSTSRHGLLRKLDNSATHYLDGQGGWSTPAGTSTGTVTTTGSPASGNLAKFSGATSITNADLTGHVTTSGGVATTIANSVVTEAMLNLTDLTTFDVSTTKHGFVPKAPNDATKFLDGTGAWDFVRDSDLTTSDITTNDVATTKHGFAPKAPNDATKFLNGVGAWAVPGVTAGWDQYKTQVSDQDVTNSTTLTDSTDLQWSVTAGSVWYIEVRIMYSGNATGGDLKHDHAVSAGNLTGFHVVQATDNTNDAVLNNTPVQDAGVANWASAVGVGTDASDTVRIFLGWAMYTFSSAATFKFRFAQNVSAVGTHARLKASSVMRGQRLL